MESSLQTKKNKKSARIPWGAIALAFVFIFNPNVNIVDPLPDVFGHIILALSLVKLSMVCPALTDARRAFERMILIDGAKILALLWVFGIEATSERNSSLMLWSFVFGMLEIGFLAPAFVKLFDGLSELGDFHTNNSIHASKKKNGQSYTDSLKKFSVFFVIFRAIMVVLPELTNLTTTSYDEHSLFFGMYRYIGVLRGICFIPVFVVGAIWLSKVISYFNRIRRDKTLCESVSNAYAQKILPKQGIFTIRNVKAATWFFVAAAVLTIDFKIDDSNIFPDIFVALFMIPALVYFCKSSKLKARASYLLIGLYGALSVLSTLAEAYFDANYSYNVMEKSQEAFTVYLVYVGFVALKSIFFISMLAVIFRQIRTVVADHTGYVLGREIHSEGERTRTAELQAELNKNFVRVIDVAIVYVLSDILCSLYGAFYAFMDKNMGWFSVINIACAIIFISVSVRAVGELRESVQTKYMLE